MSEEVPDPIQTASEPTPHQDDEEPSLKKRKTAFDEEPSEKLEHRLGGILCCAVCLDLPPAAVYQCSNGHLMCAPCFTHLLADARLRDETATCPNCRIEISKTSACRNLAVEKTVSELPSECKHCNRVFPRHSVQYHEEKTCEDREYKFNQICVDRGPGERPSGLVLIVASVFGFLLSLFRRSYLVSQVTANKRRYRRLTGCRWAVVGCGWRGPAHEARAHEAGCAYPRRSAGEAADALEARERRAADHLRLYTQIFDLLSYEKITFNDLQLKPYRTEEFVHKLYYETLRFSSFGQQWAVRAVVNNNAPRPAQLAARALSYQLLLKSKPAGELCVQWVWARGPHGEARLAPNVAAHAYRDGAEPEPRPLPLADPDDANRLLANKAIHFRLIMFLANK